MELKDQVALVTGGSSGIGRAAAAGLARRGVKVAITARRADRCQEAAEEIERGGGEVLALPGDVAQPEHIAELVAATVSRWGRLDIVVPNAGVNGVVAPIEEITPEEWNQTQAVNMGGTFLTVKYAIPHLRRAGGGSIVIVSSVNGNRVFSNLGFSAYSSSKAAQVAFAKMAAAELSQWNIRVNVVCPGATRTNIEENTHFRNMDKISVPRGTGRHGALIGSRVADAEEVADLVIYLASHEARYITGTEIYIDGGLSLF